MHGIADVIDPSFGESLCLGNPEPFPDGRTLEFYGRYRPVGDVSAARCPQQESPTTPLCRFQVVVQDSDQGDFSPSPGDYFSILSTTTTEVTRSLPLSTVIYYRAGNLDGGNLTGSQASRSAGKPRGPCRPAAVDADQAVDS